MFNSSTKWFKGIIDKNIKILNNKPLLCHSIDQAKESKYYKNKQMRIVVTTDSEKYANISKNMVQKFQF